MLIPLTEEESQKIPEELQKKHVALVNQKFVDEDDDKFSFYKEIEVETPINVMKSNHRGCSALDEKGRCTIYENRPMFCKLYPAVPVFEERQRKFMIQYAITCPGFDDVGMKEMEKRSIRILDGPKGADYLKLVEKMAEYNSYFTPYDSYSLEEIKSMSKT